MIRLLNNKFELKAWHWQPLSASRGIIVKESYHSESPGASWHAQCAGRGCKAPRLGTCALARARARPFYKRAAQPGLEEVTSTSTDATLARASR